MLTKLKLKNFRQHKDTVLEFVPGVNTIVGANNSGKSSIPEAIEFALFGSRALRDNAKGFVRDGQSDGSAVVKITLGKDSLSVGRNTKNAEVRLNGELEARYKENVSEYIGAATGVSQVGFRLGHYIRQKELSYFSALRPGKRYEVIEKMLKINAIDVAIKNLKKQISETEVSMKVLLGQFSDVNMLEDKLSDLYVGKEHEAARIESLNKDLSGVLSVLQQQRNTLMELQYIPEYNAVLLEIVECDMAQAELKLAREGLEKLGLLDESLYATLKKKLTALTLEQQAREELEALAHTPAPTPVDKPVAVDKQALIEITLRHQELQSQLGELLELDENSHCPVCKQELGKGFTTVVDCIGQQIALLKKELDKEAEEYKQAQDEYRKSEKEYNTYLTLDHRRKVYVDRRDALVLRCTDSFSSEDLVNIEKELTAFNSAKAQRAAGLACAAELEKKVARLPQLLARQEELKHVADLAEDPALAALIKENEEIERQLNKALNTATKELAYFNSSILSVQEQIDTAIQVGKKLDEYAIEIAELKSMRDAFLLFKRYLTAKIRPMLQTVAEVLFHKTTKNRYAEYLLSDDYDISLVTHEGYSRKLASISGSENDLASLCLRLAIATLRSTRLAGSLGFIILDEISGSFDDERTKQTLEGLLELKEVIPQIINITHKPVEMKYADKLFTVKESNQIATVEHS